MANKKKKTSKKGLASLVNAPRNTSINGQPHMLAYITGSEADVLKRLGGSGDPGPMGIPSFYYDDVGAGGSGTGGSTADFSSDSSSNDSSSDNSSSSDSSSDDSYDYDSDDGGDEDYNPQISEAMKDKINPDRKKNNYNYDESRDDEEQTSAITIADYDPKTGTGGDFLSKQGREDLNVLGEEAAKYFNSPITKGIQTLEKFSPLATLVRGITGAPSVTRTKSGLAAGRIGNMQMGVQRGGTVQYDSAGNISHVEMPDGTKVGERFSSSGDDDDGPNLNNGDDGSGTPVSITPSAVTPNAYYQKGVGSQTIDLSDPKQRTLFLQNLIQGTPSPIGGMYNPFQATYTTPDKEEKRLSGLDIFKRR